MINLFSCSIQLIDSKIKDYPHSKVGDYAELKNKPKFGQRKRKKNVPMIWRMIRLRFIMTSIFKVKSL